MALYVIFVLFHFYSPLKLFLIEDLLLVVGRRRKPKDPLLQLRATVPPSKVILDHNEP